MNTTSRLPGPPDPRPGRRILAALAVPALLLAGAGCGRGSTPTAAEDSSEATRIVLKPSDLPGFTLDKDDGDGNEGGFRACLKDNPTWSVRPNPRGADSSFTNDDAVGVASGALLTAKVPEARKAFADVKAATSSQCMKDEVKESVLKNAPRGLTVGGVTVESLSMPRLADESVASRFTVDLAMGADRDKLHVDVSFLRRGRTVSGLMISGVGAPFADSERIRLSTVLANRMEGKADEVAAPVASTTPPLPTTAAPPSTVAPGPTSTAVSATKWTPYRDSSGVTFEHPPTWSVERRGEIIAVFLDPAGVGPFRRNVNIVLQRPDPPMTVDQFSEGSLQQLRADKAVTSGRVWPMTLSGTPGARITHSSTDNGGMRYLSVWTVRSGGVWLVTYTSDAGPGRFNGGTADVERLLTTMKLPA